MKCKRSLMHRHSRIDWTGERELKAKRIRMVFVLSLATVFLMILGALYLSRISRPVDGQPARYSQIIGGAQMYEIAANRASRREEYRAA